MFMERLSDPAPSAEQDRAREDRGLALRAITLLRQNNMAPATPLLVAEVLVVGARRCKSGALVNTQSVQELSSLVGGERKKIWRGIKALESQSLVKDRTGSSGLRFSSYGELSGIDVTPLIDALPELEAMNRDRLNSARILEQRRTELRSVKGQLRRIISQLTENDLIASAIECLQSIPQRFGTLTLNMMQDMITRAKILLDSLQDNSTVCLPKMEHTGDKYTTPTHTKINNKSISITAENEQGSKPTPEMGGELGLFKITHEEALKLLPSNLREDIYSTYADQPELIWGELYALAEDAWRKSGQAEHIPGRIAKMLNCERQAATLILLALAADARGTVKELDRYTFGCARKALNGAFKWGIGLRGAVSRRKSLI